MGNTLNDVNIAYGGGSGNAEVIDTASPLSLTNAVVRNSSSVGVRINGASPTLTGDTFQNNNSSAVSMDDASAPMIGSPTLTNNHINGVSVDNGTITANMGWANPGIPYVVDGLTVALGATLTLGAGQVVKFAGSNSNLVVNGSMVANGTAAQPVVFTSIKDDSAGGDTNNDGIATNAAPGDWAQVRFSSSSTNDVLTNVVVSFGGTNSLGEFEADGTAPTISNSTFASSSSSGLRLVGSTATLTGDTFLNNSGSAVSIDATSAPTISSPTLTNNHINGVSVSNGTITANTSWANPGIPYVVDGLTVASGSHPDPIAPARAVVSGLQGATVTWSSMAPWLLMARRRSPSCSRQSRTIMQAATRTMMAQQAAPNQAIGRRCDFPIRAAAIC